MRALITGHCGFIGSHLYDAMVRRYGRENVTGVDRHSIAR